MIKKRYAKEKWILDILKLLITAVYSGTVYFWWVKFINPYIPIPFFRYGNYLIGALLVAVYVGFVKVYGGFQVGTASISDLVFSQGIAIAFLLGISYVAFSLLSYRLISIWPFVIMLVGFSAFAVLWVIIADAIYFAIHKPKKTIFDFNNINSYASLKGVRALSKRFDVVRTCNSDKTPLEELFGYMKSVDAVFLVGVPSEYRNEVVKKCIATGKTAYIKPKISDTIIRGGRTIQLFNIPLYRCKRSDAGLMYLVIKRFFDITLSGLGIIILAIPMLIIALCIKLDDRGPVFYRQTRLTLNGKQFKIVKFRSMKVDAEKDGVARLASEDDDRITRMGKIIRKLRLDELPQLFNIFSGSMSIVGPRPERPEIAKEYEDTMPEFALRLQAKAGLTGYAQVYGKYNTPPYDKVQMDLIYVANQSVLEDIKLILMTLKIMFIPSSTEGIDQNKTTALK